MRNRQNEAQITDLICSVTLFCSLRHEHLFEYPRHYPLRSKLCRASLVTQCIFANQDWRIHAVSCGMADHTVQL